MFTGGNNEIWSFGEENEAILKNIFCLGKQCDHIQENL